MWSPRRRCCWPNPDCGNYVFIVSHSFLFVSLSHCKVTDAGRRRLISVNHRVLMYNKAIDFGRPHPSEEADHDHKARAVFESDVRTMRDRHYATFGTLG